MYNLLASAEKLLEFFKNERSTRIFQKSLDELKEQDPDFTLEDVLTKKRPLVDTTPESTPYWKVQ